jgi:hypothetical protein
VLGRFLEVADDRGLVERTWDRKGDQEEGRQV